MVLISFSFAGAVDYIGGSPFKKGDIKDPPRVAILPEYNPIVDGIIQFCNEIDDGNDRFLSGKFQVTKLMERTYWKWIDEPWNSLDVNHWNVYYDGYVEYNVACGNHVVYSGWLNWREYDHRCTDLGSNCGARDDQDPPPLHDVDLSTYNPTSRAFGTRGLKVPESHILDIWSGHHITPPPYTYMGDATQGKLARPLLMIHGLNSDFKIWGVNPIKDENGNFLKKGNAYFMAPLVSEYLTGSLPDVLARNQNLNTNHDKINENGIYFYQAPGNRNAAGVWIDAMPHWSLSTWNSQSSALYKRIESVLTKFYGSSIWMLNPDLKIDLVCHSQGGLIVREMLRGLQQDASHFPVGDENAANHINKVITVDSPHFGSAMAGSLDQAEGDYPGLGVLLQDIENTNNGNPSERELVSAHVDVGFMKRVSSGASAGYDGTGGTPVCILTEGVSCITGVWWGAIFGAFTDVYLNISGPYLGPYKVTVTKDIPGPWNSEDKNTLDGPSGFAQRISSGRDGASHLDPFDVFISRMVGANGSGFPRRPDGTKVTLLPLYSEDMRPVLGNMLGQLSEGADRFCAEKSTEEGCFAMGGLLRSYVKKSEEYDVGDIDFSDEMFTMLNNLQNNWLKNSDVVVESKSQQFKDVNAGLLPTNADLTGFFKEPREFVLHDALAPWEALPHAGFAFDEVEVEELSATLGMDNPGATQQGLDLLCALSEPCDKAIGGYTKGAFLRMALNALVEWVPSPAPITAQGYPVSSQFVDISGNFSISPIWVDKGYQGLAVKDADGRFQLVTAYQPGQGTYLWYVDDAGQMHYELLIGPEILAHPSLKRVNNQLTITMANYSGRTIEKQISLSLPESIKILVLADQGASMIALLPGTGVATDPLTQTAPTPPVSSGLGPTTIRVFHVEARSKDEVNTSRPRFLVQNISEQPIHGYKVAYYFTADPARKPMVELDYPKDNVSLENLGGDQWRFVIHMPSTVLQPGAFSPSKEGWQIRLHYGDWSDWENSDDYSANYSVGFIKTNTKIVVYDNAGKILWGKEPPKFDSQTTGIIPTASLQMSWIDAAPGDLNMFKPQVTIQNTGTVAIENYHAFLYFRVPTGKQLQPPPQDWYTPESHPVVRELGNGVWELDLHFDQHILYGGQNVVEGNIGLNLTDWSAFDKTMLGLALVDQNGIVLFGSKIDPSAIPSIPETTPAELHVWIRDEAPTDQVWVKPRVRLVNQGSTPIKAFTLTFPFTTESDAKVLLEAWYAPQCQATLVGISPNRAVSLQCLGLAINPGSTWPDNAGASFGLHYENWAAWDKANDAFMTGVSTNWAQAPSVIVSGVLAQ